MKCEGERISWWIFTPTGDWEQKWGHTEEAHQEGAQRCCYRICHKSLGESCHWKIHWWSWLASLPIHKPILPISIIGKALCIFTILLFHKTAVPHWWCISWKKHSWKFKPQVRSQASPLTLIASNCPCISSAPSVCLFADPAAGGRGGPGQRLGQQEGA